MAGWQEGFLQRVLEDPICGDSAGSGDVQSCSLFDIADDNTMQQCTFPKPFQLQNVNDECTDQGKGLPGDNPLQFGPQAATIASKAGPTDAAKVSSSVVQEVTSSSSTSMPQPTYTQASASSASGADQPAFANTAEATDIAPSSSSPVVATFTLLAHPTSPPPSQDIPSQMIAPAAYYSDQSTAGVASVSMSTDGATVWAINVVEATVTVTATGPEPSSDKLRRHLHDHRHHHFGVGHKPR